MATYLFIYLFLFFMVFTGSRSSLGQTFEHHSEDPTQHISKNPTKSQIAKNSILKPRRSAVPGEIIFNKSQWLHL